MNSSTVPHDRVAIVGTGFGAIATAIRLRKAGVEDFVMIDRAGEVGGVWRDNSYPGAAVDVKSHLYSLSSAPNPDWHNVFARRGELYAYLRDIADRFDLRRRLVLNCEVEEMRWDAEEQRWELDTAAGPRTAQHVVVATGALAEPVVPDLPGLATFEGPVFHSARWDHSVDLTGKRVAVVGTGASAIQFVPAIQPTVGHLTLFQRTPPWIMPRHDHEIPARTRRMFRALPFTQRLVRAGIYLRFEWMILAFWHPRLMRIAERTARRYLRQQVPDPELRRRLTPSYSLGCKRILLSDDYLPSLTQPNVSVHTDGIREITERGVVDRAGARHEVDAIVLGTGFRTMGLPLTDRIHDAEGVSMRESWGGRPTSYLGTAVAGYPNCYLMHGPNIGTGHNSVLQMFESQANYIAAAVTYARDHGLAAVQPTRAAQAAYSAEIEAMSDGTVWTAGGCQSWYLDEHGRNVNIWPGTTFGFRRRTRSFDPAAHLLHRPLSKPAVVGAPIEEPA
ncbi:MAG TPA: NAD(P)/FAD-dependent oxidoreductase [Solirubrobacterales bacterium]|jgi:cation diffusion facilitator CzcD-associated flavoprotein CzcO|nr:NAD(P)/FAD-dependent oxidoreductase [Solirubrobacterales bacterium]